MPICTPETAVCVYPFTRLQEGPDVIIGRPETGVFLSVPPEAVELLDWLADGKSIQEASRLYQSKYSELPDMDEFLATLEANGMVRISGAPEGVRPVPEPPPVKRYHWTNFPEKLAKRIFSWPVLIAASFVILAAIGAMSHDHSLIPGGRDLYFPRHRTLVWTILMIVSYGSVAVHECMHMIAARAQGVNSRLGLGNRLWDLVVECDMSGLWAVPKRNRYLPLLAGSLFDAFVGSLLVFVLVASGRHWFHLPEIAIWILRALLFTYVTRVMWQAFIFVRTDYYYVIANFLNCRNLLGDTEAFLRNQLAKILPAIRKTDLSYITAVESRVIPVYALVWIGGRIVAFTWLFNVTIPLISRYVGNLSRALSAGFSKDPYNFLDSLVLVCYFVLPIAIGFPMWIRSIVRGFKNLRGLEHGATEAYSA